MKKNGDGLVETRVETSTQFQSSVEMKKEWIAPELKKVDIEAITGNGAFLSSDGHTSS
jgi:hypothetical protein